MKPSRLAKLVLLPLLALAAHAVRAEDIDLYAGSTANGTAPNLLIVLDNSAAWDSNQVFTCAGSYTPPAVNGSTVAAFNQCGLYNAVDAIGKSPSLVGNINLGLMYFPTSKQSGGQFVLPTSSVSSPASSLLLMDSAGITKMKQTIDGLRSSADKSNNNQISETMQEAWAFYQGKTGLSGAHYPGTNAGSTCGRNFVLYIATATTGVKPQDGTGNLAKDRLNGAANATQPQLSLPSWPGAKSQFAGIWADEWAKFMYSGTVVGQAEPNPSITTYTIIIKDGTNPDYEQYLVGMAEAGGGKYFLVTLGDTSALAQALLAIFNEVQAVNSVFASPGLPVTSNAQGTYLNQIFLASFRPDADGKPRWLGNLKQYQFGVDTTGLYTTPATGVSLFLGDASWADINSVTGVASYPTNRNANSALSSAGTGFISPNAISFWTTRDTTRLPDSAGGFWVNKAGIGAGFDLADGQYVEKGGIGQSIRLAQLQDIYSPGTPTTSRRLYTCFPAASCTGSAALSSMPFKDSNSNLTDTALGITNPIYTASISTISRTATDVTVTLSATPSPSITNPATIVISGTTGGQFDGAIATASPNVSGPTITYKLPKEMPIAPAGAYVATGSTSSTSGVSSLTRTTNSGWITASATLSDTSFGGGATVAVNDVISISGSTGYNGSSYLVTDVSGSTVKFKMQGSPSPYDGGATIWVGANAKTNNSATTSSAGSYGSSIATGLIRGTNCTGCTTPSGQVLMVNIPGGTTNSFIAGNTVKISGAAFYSSTTGYQVIGVGAACKVDVTTSSSGTVTTYTGTANVVTTKPATTTTYTLCLDLGSSFAYSPGLTSNGASVGTTASRAGAGSSKSVIDINRAQSSCPSSNNATTQIKVVGHGFAMGSTVTLGRSDGGPNEGYNGAYTISNVTTDTFDIQIATKPSCTDNKGTISYQSSANGSTTASTLINWVRGQDNIGDEPSPPDPASPAAPITVRGSVHGDVLHSRPAVINYGGTTGVVVFYGANDGVFRAINGNQPPATNTRPTGTVASQAATYTPMGSCSISGNCFIGGIAPGGELWSFVPSEFYSKLQRLYSNSPDLLLATTSKDIKPAPTPKDYFFDGPTATYQTYDSSGNTTGAYIFLTARRGGRVMYAFDVTDPTNPRFMWKHTNADAGFTELGQTWSLPKVAFVRGYLNTATTPATPKPVLIFGAGYDGNGYDVSTGTIYAGNDDNDKPTTAAMGRGIFILDAMTGDLVWRTSPTNPGCPSGASCLVTTGMTHSIAADITTIDTNFDGYVDRLYAADTGGNIWRVDLEAKSLAVTPSVAPSTWQVTHLASLGGTTSSASPRKFLFAPDAVLTKNFTSVLVGSGDREHPLSVQAGAYNTVNRFYMILDSVTGVDSSGWTTVVDDSDSSSAAAPSQGTLFNASTQPFNITTSVCSAGCKGYYLLLNQNPQSATEGASSLGEQVVNAATTIGGYTYFGTNQPKPADTNTCSANLGNARAYKVGFLTGSGGFTLLDGGGLPPSPVAGIVVVDVLGVPTSVPFVIGGGGGAVSGTTGGGTLTTCSGPDCKSSLGGGTPPPPPPGKKKRTYWYRQIDQ